MGPLTRLSPLSFLLLFMHPASSLAESSQGGYFLYSVTLNAAYVGDFFECEDCRDGEEHAERHYLEAATTYRINRFKAMEAGLQLGIGNDSMRFAGCRFQVQLGLIDWLWISWGFNPFLERPITGGIDGAYAMYFGLGMQIPGPLFPNSYTRLTINIGMMDGRKHGGEGYLTAGIGLNFNL